MNRIETIKLEKDLFYKKALILKYSISYPKITYSDYSNCMECFNLYNESIALELQRRAENELFTEAKELYDFNSSNGYPLMTYEVMLDFNITYNFDNLLSLYYDEYIFSGGAHGNTIRSSQNWDLLNCYQVPFYCFWNNNPYFLIDVFKSINRQIAKNPEYFFDNYCELVLETFNPESYYITPNCLTVFFQQYDIAPYSSGIQTFCV